MIFLHTLRLSVNMCITFIDLKPQDKSHLIIDHDE
jgi:hypothetical protein